METTVCVVGLGYVGYPLAEAFSHHIRTIGYDVDARKIQAIGRDPQNRIIVTSDPNLIGEADFVLICVPTPVTIFKDPDLSFVVSAATVVGDHLRKNAVVVLESTVYPGVTEDIVKPILEKRSGYSCGKDFFIGYSPERINPGDRDHTLGKITKVVAGMDAQTTERLCKLYGLITTVFPAKDIPTAEAAKVIENIQRDLNIALMNELAIIFHRMGLDSKAILDAASTKWNFMRFHPGLVGGHCIPVDPYYLVHKARELEYHPQVILAGRAINDSMPRYVAELTLRGLIQAGKVVKNSHCLVMGLTYKENVPDTRESPTRDVIRELTEYGIICYGYDPLLSPEEIRRFKVEPLLSLDTPERFDSVVIAVAHNGIHSFQLEDVLRLCTGIPVIMDVKGIFFPKEGIVYRTL
jgi:UDP-N-acetyl-D-galactosamine dehydrogenase